MQTNLYLAFIGISIAVIVFPGPSILLIVANSLQRGTAIGMYTVAGGIVAMALQLAVALVALTSLVSLAGIGLDYVRGLGAAYLLYLGIRRWRGSAADGAARGRTARNYGSAWFEGFVVALTNPGTMLFFVAFFPQFLNTAAPAGPQLILLAISFLLLCVLFDTAYALLAARIGNRLHDPQRVKMRNRISGALLMLAAVVLAFVNV